MTTRPASADEAQTSAEIKEAFDCYDQMLRTMQPAFLLEQLLGGRSTGRLRELAEYLFGRELPELLKSNGAGTARHCVCSGGGTCGPCADDILTGTNDPDLPPNRTVGYDLVALMRAAEYAMSLPYLPTNGLPAIDELWNLPAGTALLWDPAAIPDNIPEDTAIPRRAGAFTIGTVGNGEVTLGNGIDATEATAIAEAAIAAAIADGNIAPDTTRSDTEITDLSNAAIAAAIADGTIGAPAAGINATQAQAIAVAAIDDWVANIPAGDASVFLGVDGNGDPVTEAIPDFQAQWDILDANDDSFTVTLTVYSDGSEAVTYSPAGPPAAPVRAA